MKIVTGDWNMDHCRWLKWRLLQVTEMTIVRGDWKEDYCRCLKQGSMQVTEINITAVGWSEDWCKDWRKIIRCNITRYYQTWHFQKKKKDKKTLPFLLSLYFHQRYTDRKCSLTEIVNGILYVKQNSHTKSRLYTSTCMRRKEKLTKPSH